MPHRLPDPLPRAAHLDPAQFLSRYLEPSRPVVLLDEMRAWRALDAWSPAALCAEHGERRIQIHVHREGLYTSREVDLARTTFRAFFAELERGARDRFLIENVLTNLPYLVPDYEIPSVVSPEQVAESGMWIAPARTRTGLHWDSRNGLLGVIRGAKRVWLFSPDQVERLYPHALLEPSAGRNKNWSQLDIFAVDEARFPQARDAAYYETVVAPGELLLIPENWWHAVQNEGEINIAVNFWLEPPAQRTGPAFYTERRLLAAALQALAT